ncbi:uncharacterized protein [Hetaerina americana]|uniref:uncharacterized protein n=1 Tax=Hetaerina americana TaxID=62018 RepID=UPI003A7F1202
MQNHQGNTLLLAGDKCALNPTLLFQFASHWAEIGVRVSYLSATPLNELPPPIHGADFPSSSALNQIQFLYLPKWQDLMQHLFSLHCHALVPRALIVKGLNHYCSNVAEQSSTKDWTTSDISRIAHISAVLLDALKVCSARNGAEETYCVCSYEVDNGLESQFLVPCLSAFSIFFDNIWIVESMSRGCCEHNARNCKSSDKCSVIKMKKLLTSGLKEDGSIVEFSSCSNVLFLTRFLNVLWS